MATSTLYQRYLRAAGLWKAHCAACPVCRAWVRTKGGACCTGGAPLYQKLAVLQDAYNRQLRTR
ncbi:hypothetical protein OHA98_42395 [Streptomyces sp. NBC_00654]|uniref:hypothetical protein n=1 Tax=Streptomyces sp. NBC_00654 TaxID=2975799 RepID=UPI00224FE976|nr:hypothetical protein [Streptomyces sp. NBC_00654]MCX4971252.1 hypothetical protein [Streptomyces sp. NBC_00654]